MTAQLTSIYDLLEAAEQTGWEWEATDDGRIEFSRQTSGLYEPSWASVVPDGGVLSVSQRAHKVRVSGPGGEREVFSPGAGVLKMIRNTEHPLRSGQFFAIAGHTAHGLLKPSGLPASLLRDPSVRGYFPWKHADRAAVRLLRLTPFDVWGADAWLRCYEEGWA